MSGEISAGDNLFDELEELEKRLFGKDDRIDSQKPNPPIGWELSECGKFFERTGDDKWIVPSGCEASYGGGKWWPSRNIGRESSIEITYRMRVR